MLRHPQHSASRSGTRSRLAAGLVCAAALGGCLASGGEIRVEVPHAGETRSAQTMENGVSSAPWRSVEKPRVAAGASSPAPDEPSPAPAVTTAAVVPSPVPEPVAESGERPSYAARPTDQRRVALVVGNSRYQNIEPLKNPRNDAEALARSLERRDFEVLAVTDQTRSQLDETIRQFSAMASGADVALYFYSGHAIQVDGKNWMLPVDAQIESEVDVAIAANPMDVVFDQMSTKADTSIVFLDACRNNPFASRMSTGTRSGPATRGLTRPQVNGEIYIAFSTAPGEVALDGDGDNSPFTTALLEHLETPDIELEELMRKVRRDVQERTADEPVQQRPWGNSSLTRQFYF